MWLTGVCGRNALIVNGIMFFFRFFMGYDWAYGVIIAWIFKGKHYTLSAKRLDNSIMLICFQRILLWDFFLVISGLGISYPWRSCNFFSLILLYKRKVNGHMHIPEGVPQKSTCKFYPFHFVYFQRFKILTTVLVLQPPKFTMPSK